MAIRGDLHERRVFVICRREGEWRVMDGEDTLAACADYALASAAAARLAREAFNAGTPVRIVEG
jgi:hypothetical protein